MADNAPPPDDRRTKATFDLYKEPLKKKKAVKGVPPKEFLAALAFVRASLPSLFLHRNQLVKSYRTQGQRLESAPGIARSARGGFLRRKPSHRREKSCCWDSTRGNSPFTVILNTATAQQRVGSRQFIPGAVPSGLT